MEVSVFSTDLGPLFDAVSALSLYFWHLLQHMRGLLLQTLATLCLRALLGSRSVSVGGRVKCPGELLHREAALNQ